MSWYKSIKLPHVFVLLACIVFVSSLLTYVIPSGSYQRVSKTIGTTQRTLVVPGTYKTIPKHYSLRGVFLGEESTEVQSTPVSIHGFLTAIPRGLEKSADIIFFIFLIGGVFGVLQRTGTIPAVIRKLLDLLGHSSTWLTIIIMVTLAIGGSTLGMGEEFIPLVPIFLIISNRMGFDRIYGLALVMLAADMGFAAATTNPFTVNIAQNIAELPLNSGIWLRIIFFICCMTVTVTYVLRYGYRIKANPSASLLAGDGEQVVVDNLDEHKFSTVHGVTLISCLLIFAGILYGVQKFDWWMSDMAGGFLLMGLIAAFLCKLSPADSIKAFVKGMEDMLVAALVVGFARGIQVVMQDGQIMDTVIYAAASMLETVPRYVSVVGMLFFQTTLNFFIPSGSGQAVVTMPLMAPLADVLGITRQTAVLAFQFGDGLSNTIIPTSGMLMAMLSLAKIPYTKWVRFFLPLFLQLLALAAVFLIIAVVIDYQ